IFSAANSYRGRTTIDDGILTIRNSQALGLGDGTLASGTVVNKAPGLATTAGTLQLDGSAGSLTVTNELLTLNGPGFTNLGSLHTLAGHTTRTANTVLGGPTPNGSNAVINTATGTSLTVGNPTLNDGLGKVIDQQDLVPSGGTAVFSLTKIGTGNLIF